MSKVAKSRSKKKTQKPQSRFERKWAEVEKKQRRNQLLQNKIADFYQTFEISALPAERALLTADIGLARHLVNFTSRKSLSDNQRVELNHWIGEIVESVSGNPFCEPEHVEALNQVMDEHGNQILQQAKDQPLDEEDLDEMREMVNEMFDGAKTFSDEQLRAFIENPALLKDELEAFFDEMLAQLDEDDEDDEFDGDGEFEADDGFDEHSAQDPHQTERQAKLKGLFDEAELGKIYKMLANALHPDKETDPERKAWKSEQMAALSKAKKAKDAFTLISMLQTHLPEKAKEIDPNLTEALCGLLNDKIDTLEREYRDIPHSCGIMGIVWQRFGGRSKKQSASNLNNHVFELDQMCKGARDLIKEVRNVKTLKQVLRERMQDDLMMIPADFERLTEEFFATHGFDFDDEPPF